MNAVRQDGLEAEPFQQCAGSVVCRIRQRQILIPGFVGVQQVQSCERVPKLGMNYEVAAEGNANGLAGERHLPRNHAQETRNLPLFIADQRGKRSVEPGISEVEFAEK